jgi:hypothetical protein
MPQEQQARPFALASASNILNACVVAKPDKFAIHRKKYDSGRFSWNGSNIQLRWLMNSLGTKKSLNPKLLVVVPAVHRTNTLRSAFSTHRFPLKNLSGQFPRFLDLR